MATIQGDTGMYEGVGSTVEIGNHKQKKAIGATIQFVDANSSRPSDFFRGGTKFGDFQSATSTLQEGVKTGTATYKDDLGDDEVYTLKVATSTEPIDTHPNFVAKIGGKKGENLHQAIFDKDGTFKSFPTYYLKNQEGDKGEKNAKGEDADWGDQNRFAGVQSYLSASATWTKSYKSASSPKLTGLGKISKPSGNPPTPAGRNWLYVGFSASFQSPPKGDKTKVVQGTISQEWRLSGRNGWDIDIYGEGDADEGGAPVGGGGGAAGGGGGA